MSMEPCRFGTMCWRPLCPYVHACSPSPRKSKRQDEEQIVDLEEEIREVVKDSLGECVPESIMGQRTRPVHQSFEGCGMSTRPVS